MDVFGQGQQRYGEDLATATRNRYRRLMCVDGACVRQPSVVGLASSSTMLFPTDPGITCLCSTWLLRTYYRLMGARIGRGVVIDRRAKARPSLLFFTLGALV